MQSVSLQKRRFTQLTARVGDLEDSLGGVLDVRARCWSLLTSSWHEKNRSISLLHRCAPHRRGSEYAPWMVNLTSGRRPVHPPRNRCWRKLDRRSRNWSASALGKTDVLGIRETVVGTLVRLGPCADAADVGAPPLSAEPGAVSCHEGLSVRRCLCRAETEDGLRGGQL